MVRIVLPSIIAINCAWTKLTRKWTRVWTTEIGWCMNKVDWQSGWEPVSFCIYCLVSYTYVMQIQREHNSVRSYGCVFNVYLPFSCFHGLMFYCGPLLCRLFLVNSGWYVSDLLLFLCYHYFREDLNGTRLMEEIVLTLDESNFTTFFSSIMTLMNNASSKIYVWHFSDLDIIGNNIL